MARQRGKNKREKKALKPNDTGVISAKPRRKAMILEEINTPSAAVPGSESVEGLVCPIIPVDLPIVTQLPPLFALEELGINLESIGLSPGETLTPTAKEYLDELLVDYFEELQKLFGDKDFADNFNLDDISTWPSLEELVKVPPPPVTVPPGELPDVGGAVDSLPPPTTVPVDPPGSNGNVGGENTEKPVEKVYDFPTRNQPLVGVIDTGLGADNPDIDYGRVSLGYDRVGRDRNSLLRAGEGNEHGSHVLGIIGATRDNGVGIDGINDKAPLWVGRAIGSGQWAQSLREFVVAAKRSGQKNAVVNLSLDLTQTNPDGSVTTRYKFTPAERQAIKYAEDNGVLIVAAAGNDGDVMSVLGQASQEFDNIITVGAADGENRAAYSSYGNGLDILAPGGTADNPVTSTVGDGLGTMAGTSVAAAKVTGAASLVWAANPSLNFSQVKEILRATAQDLGAADWDEETGAGLLDLDGAVERAKVTTGRRYAPQQSFISNRWNIDRGVTAGERAVQNYRMPSATGRAVYHGYLNSSNPSDKLSFSLDRRANLQFAFPNDGGSAELYTASGRRLRKAVPHRENRSSLYASADLEPGDYYIKVDKGSRSATDYGLIMNFDHQKPDRSDGEYWLPRSVLRKEPSFNKPTPKPSKDLAQIQREREREEALRKRELERRPREQQEIREAEASDRDAIDLVEKKGEVQPNSEGNKDVELDLNTPTQRELAEKARLQSAEKSRLELERRRREEEEKRKVEANDRDAIFSKTTPKPSSKDLAQMELERRRREEEEKRKVEANDRDAIDLVEKKGEVQPNSEGNKDVELDLNTRIQRELAEKARRQSAEKARLELERRRREEEEKRKVEKNARDTIDLVEKKNARWLGEVRPNSEGNKDVEFDLNTGIDNHATAIKYFENGYIIWNGRKAVAYKEGTGTSSGVEAQPNPRRVPLHDRGLQNGRADDEDLAENPNVGAVVDTLPPPAGVPIDPPRNNYDQDNNDSKDYDFPLKNQPLIGILDTGLGKRNPDIDYRRVDDGRDYVDDDGNPFEKPGTVSKHGTHVLGIIGATRNNGIGIDGINDKAPLWVERTIGSGKWAESLRRFAREARRSRQKNAIANLSLDLTQTNPDGSVTTRYKLTPDERDAIEYARQRGVLIVAAAGNDGDVMSALGQASQEFDNIITVGAADGENRAAYSSYGNGLDILAEGGTADNPVTSTVGDGLGTMAGTSVATAKVTGAASLVWAANPNLNYRQVKEILKITAKDVEAPGWDRESGAGLLDLDKAVGYANKKRGRSYTPQESLISDKWGLDRGVTAGERAVQSYDITRPNLRRAYYGHLYSGNPSDKLHFRLDSSANLEFAFNHGGSAKLYNSYGSWLTTGKPHHENPNSLYSSIKLGPGNYYMKVDKGRRSETNYELIMNFDHQNPDDGFDSTHYLPRPVLSSKPSFDKTPPKPPKDKDQIQKDNARAAKRRAEALEKKEAEDNARKAIDLAFKKNAGWLGKVQRNGQGQKDVELDWNTRMDNRVAAIKYFDNGYIIWNGIHAVAYREGSGTSSGEEAQADPRQVRLHDWGLHNGRVEYGTYIGESERDDYYKFSVEDLKDAIYNKHKLQFALRNSSGGISSKDAQFQILDEDFNPISLKQRWEPEKNTGETGLAYLDTLRDGQTYYVRVKPKDEYLDYQVIMNLDSAGQDFLYPARNVGYLNGRQQFRDYIGNKGDTNGDYYKFYLQDKSFLRFSLGELEPGSKIKAEILDKDNRVVPLNYFDGSYGDVSLDEGHYYLRLLPEGDTSTNYLLTTQMAEELGEYAGRHEFQNRSVWDDDAYYRFTVGEQGARDFHLKLKQKEGFTNVELRRDVGGGIVNSELVTPDVSQGNPQGAKKLFFVGANKRNGKDDLYRRYDNLPPGRYIVKVNLDSDFESYAEYDLLMNMDLAGNTLETARDLGDLSGKRVELKDFVGWNQGDNVDFYKFTTDNREFRLQFALREMTGAPHIDVLDENGNVIPLKEFDDGGSDRYGNVLIRPHGTYYLRVKSPDNPDDSTNYKLVVNATDDVAILIDGHTVAGDIYKVYKDDEIRRILGKPTWGVQHHEGSNSDFQIFEGGSIVSSSHGTFPLHGSIREYYVKTTGGLGGSLGPPTSGEYSSPTGIRQDFAKGYITWNNGSYEGFDENGVPLFGVGGGASSEAMERFFQWAEGEEGIRRRDYKDYSHYKHYLRGECVSLVARYVQDVFLPESQWHGIKYGHGKDTASTVASKFGQYFEPYTKAGLPNRGAVVSWPGGEHGHTGIVMESRRFNGQRQVRILESNYWLKGVNSKVRIGGWESIENANGWTNPKVETANGSSGGNSSGSNAGSSSGSNNSEDSAGHVDQAREERKNTLFQKLYEFFDGINDWAQEDFGDIGIGPFVAAAEALIENPLKEYLEMGAKDWQHLPVYKQIDNAASLIGNAIKPLINQLASLLQQAFRKGIKQMSDWSTSVAAKIYLELSPSQQDELLSGIEKIVSFNRSGLMKGIQNFNLSKAFSGIVDAFKKWGDLIGKVAGKALPSSTRKAVKSLAKKAKKAPGPLKFVGYMFDGLQIGFGEDKLKEVFKVIGATVGSGLLGAVVQPPASTAPGLGNLLLGAIAAFAGAWLGEFLGGQLYDLLKPLLDNFKATLANAFNQLTEKAKESDSWEVAKRIFWSIPVSAEEQDAYDAAQIWKKQFGLNSDYESHLSEASRNSLYA